MKLQNKVQLITYPDSLGGNLKTLKAVIDKHYAGLFQGGIHILPPFPSSGDRGYAPLTYSEIYPPFGTWDDIKSIGETHDIMLDFMVNHISAKSKYFLDFLSKGRKSKYYDLFLTIDKVFPNGNPTDSELGEIVLRRDEPYSDFTIEETGEIERVWTTFGETTPSEQVDLDINSETTKEFLRKYFRNFSDNNISIVRLDAIGYMVKKPGSSFFMVDPEIYEILDWISDMAQSYNIELLPEVHAHYTIQFKLAEKGYWIYDFILPYMILESFYFRNGERLKKYLKERPSNQFTMLDCHDGLPIKPDLEDLVEATDIKKVVNVCVERGANLSKILSKNNQSEDDFEVHQINASFYSLLDYNDRAYISARAIQLFTPGIPQIYYVGLLAGENDYEAVKTGGGRGINRHDYSLEEIDNAVEENVVKRLIKLIKFRNDYPAFDGKFSLIETEPHIIKMNWKNGISECSLTVNLKNYEAFINYFSNDNYVKEKL
ncbi:MAG: sucrose phosphorylase [Ignavibacteriae bacterium]|nr:sucrose phosphorylase [Ignavibacteriota bacterium]